MNTRSQISFVRERILCHSPLGPCLLTRQKNKYEKHVLYLHFTVNVEFWRYTSRWLSIRRNLIFREGGRQILPRMRLSGRTRRSVIHYHQCRDTRLPCVLSMAHQLFRRPFANQLYEHTTRNRSSPPMALSTSGWQYSSVITFCLRRAGNGEISRAPPKKLNGCGPAKKNGEAFASPSLNPSLRTSRRSVEIALQTTFECHRSEHSPDPGVVLKFRYPGDGEIATRRPQIV